MNTEIKTPGSPGLFKFKFGSPTKNEDAAPYRGGELAFDNNDDTLCTISLSNLEELTYKTIPLPPIHIKISEVVAIILDNSGRAKFFSAQSLLELFKTKRIVENPTNRLKPLAIAFFVNFTGQAIGYQQIHYQPIKENPLQILENEFLKLYVEICSAETLSDKKDIQKIKKLVEIIVQDIEKLLKHNIQHEDSNTFSFSLKIPSFLKSIIPFSSNTSTANMHDQHTELWPSAITEMKVDRQKELEFWHTIIIEYHLKKALEYHLTLNIDSEKKELLELKNYFGQYRHLEEIYSFDFKNNKEKITIILQAALYCIEREFAQAREYVQQIHTSELSYVELVFALDCYFKDEAFIDNESVTNSIFQQMLKAIAESRHRDKPEIFTPISQYYQRISTKLKGDDFQHSGQYLEKTFEILYSAYEADKKNKSYLDTFLKDYPQFIKKLTKEEEQIDDLTNQLKKCTI